MNIYQADNLSDIWNISEFPEDDMISHFPYWTTTWPGSRALARYILDNRKIFKDKVTLDVACGSGLAAVASAFCGAISFASDSAIEAVRMSRFTATINNLDIQSFQSLIPDFIPAKNINTIFVGDVFYESSLSLQFEAWLRIQARRGICVIAANPMRQFAPYSGIQKLKKYRVPIDLALEGISFRDTEILQILP